MATDTATITITKNNTVVKEFKESVQFTDDKLSGYGAVVKKLQSDVNQALTDIVNEEAQETNNADNQKTKEENDEQDDDEDENADPPEMPKRSANAANSSNSPTKKKKTTYV